MRHRATVDYRVEKGDLVAHQHVIADVFVRRSLPPIHGYRHQRVGIEQLQLLFYLSLGVQIEFVQKRAHDCGTRRWGVPKMLREEVERKRALHERGFARAHNYHLGVVHIQAIFGLLGKACRNCALPLRGEQRFASRYRASFFLLPSLHWLMDSPTRTTYE